MTVIAEARNFRELAYLQAATRIRYAGFYFAKPFFLDDSERDRRVAPDVRAVSMPRERFETRGERSARVTTCSGQTRLASTSVARMSLRAFTASARETGVSALCFAGHGENRGTLFPLR